jgi:hypothetical protein
MSGFVLKTGCDTIHPSSSYQDLSPARWKKLSCFLLPPAFHGAAACLGPRDDNGRGVREQQRCVHIPKLPRRVRFDPWLTADRAGQSWAQIGLTLEPLLRLMGHGVRIRSAPNRPVCRYNSSHENELGTVSTHDLWLLRATLWSQSPKELGQTEPNIMASLS